MKKFLLINFLFMSISLLSQTISLSPEGGYTSSKYPETTMIINYELKKDSYSIFVFTDETLYNFSLDNLVSFRESLEKFISWNLKADSLQVVIEKKIYTFDEAKIVAFKYGDDWYLSASV